MKHWIIIGVIVVVAIILWKKYGKGKTMAAGGTKSTAGATE